jgi:hypothetical protein
MLRYFLLLLVVLMATSSHAQSRRKRAKKETARSTQSNSLAPGTTAPSYYPTEDYDAKIRKRKKASGKVTYTAREKFYERMEELEKEQRKNEKLMEKPQYSDPSYFGHKRPPKRRPPGKMKFCKECKIRH